MLERKQIDLARFREFDGTTACSLTSPDVDVFHISCNAYRAGTAAWQLSLLLYRAYRAHAAAPSSSDTDISQFLDWLKRHSFRVPLFAVALNAEANLKFRGNFAKIALDSLHELHAFKLLLIE